MALCFQDGSWINRGVEKGLGMESVSLSAVEADHSDDLWVPQPQGMKASALLGGLFGWLVGWWVDVGRFWLAAWLGHDLTDI